jgi:hypothetical protein
VTGQVIDFDCRDQDELDQAQALARGLGWFSTVAIISILA